jgi:multicomponent Na+:H+ antiporter subunit D
MGKLALWLGILLSAGQVFVVLFHPAWFWDRIGTWEHFFAPRLQADMLSLVLLFSIGIVIFTAVLVGWQTITEPKQWLNFISLVLIALIGMNGTVLLSDLFSLYVFLEVTAVSSFILIAFQRDLNALEGAFKYIILSAVASVLMLSSIALLLLVSGDTSFAVVSSCVRDSSGSVLVKLAVGIFICGLFIKGGLVPFHGWVPGAYSAAPAAVSVLLAGVVTKVSGIYALIRVVASVFGSNDSVNSILMITGVVSILTGALAALGQNDFKRMLAYSSISQVGYIVLGLGCGSPLGVVGAVFHLFNHSVFKTLLFVNSAAVEQQVGTTDMNRMGGLGARMPFTNVTSLIGFLSAAGVPPTSGFWSKLIIVVALWQSHHYTYAFIAVLASVVTLAYLLSMQRKVFFGILSEKLQDIREAGYGIVLPAVVLAVITVGVGLLFPLAFNSVVMPIGSFLK